MRARSWEELKRDLNIEEDLFKNLSQFESLGRSSYTEGQLNTISDLMDLLGKMPLLDPIWDFEIHIAVLNKIPYNLYYIVNEREKSITVVGLLHQKQDNSNQILR